MQIKIANPAHIDLYEIDDYIRSNNPSAAGRLVIKIDKVIDCLTTYPAMGRVGRKFKTRELIVSGTPFIIVYEIRKQIIFIARILHSSRKWPDYKNKH